MEKSKDTEMVLILVLVVALAVGVYFYVSTKGKNDAIGDVVNKAIGTGEKVIETGVGTVATGVGGATRFATGLVGGSSGPSASQLISAMDAKIAEGNAKGVKVVKDYLADPFGGNAYKLSSIPLAPGTVNVRVNNQVVQQAPTRVFTVAPTAPSATSYRKV